MVLEAWEKAEKIGYQYIGEEIREPSNIVEYNINKEITKDASNVINANNDTTTGMATLIYGVNAPKLLEKTSVYRNTTIQGQSTLSFSQDLIRPDDTYGRIREATITKNYGNITFENRKIEAYRNNGTQALQYNGVVIPMTGAYQLEITYPTGSSSNTISTQVKIARGKNSLDETIASYSNNSVYPYTETTTYTFEAGDAIYVYNEYEYTGTGTGPYTRNFTTQIVITLL